MPRARLRAAEIMVEIDAWRAEHGALRCPSWANLRPTVDPELDPWNRPFRIECRFEEIVVRSLGPDGQIGTLDDVSIHQRLVN